MLNLERFFAEPIILKQLALETFNFLAENNLGVMLVSEVIL